MYTSGNCICGLIRTSYHIGIYWLEKQKSTHFPLLVTPYPYRSISLTSPIWHHGATVAC